MADPAHLRKEPQYVVTLRVGIGQQVEEDWGVLDNIFEGVGLGGGLDLQLSVSKNSVLISMKNFPNNERFWQYNWTLSQ